MASNQIIDLGHSHTLRFTAWDPDRILNPQYDGIPSEPRAGATIDHLTPAGEQCSDSGMVTFDTPLTRAIWPDRPRWIVECWEPLTISPSVRCSCGDHGFIRNGRWEPV